MKEKVSLAGRDTVQPYTIAVNGKDINESTAYVVVIDKHLFPMESGKKAIDFCFKMFHIFNAKYPVASRHLWRMVEVGVYKFKNEPFDCPSHLQATFEKLEKRFFI